MFPPSLCVDFGGGIGKNIYEGFKDSDTVVVVESMIWRDRNLKFGPNYDLEEDNFFSKLSSARS